MAENSLPIQGLEGTPLFEALKTGLDDLVKNGDLLLTTSYEKVVGHLCKKVREVQSEQSSCRRLM